MIDYDDTSEQMPQPVGSQTGGKFANDDFDKVETPAEASAPYHQMRKEELYQLAKKADIRRRSFMTKVELMEALIHHYR